MTETAPMSGKPEPLPDGQARHSRPVLLIDSARFVCASLNIPPGINARDVFGYLEGEIEALSPFPLEATAWGYIQNRRGKQHDTALTYAAFRDQINLASPTSRGQAYAVLPGFLCLTGRSSQSSCWVVLAEKSCMTLARIPAKSSAPDRIESLYFTQADTDPEQTWALRQRLIKASPEIGDDRVEDGIIRCTEPTIERHGAIRFPLEQQRSPGAPWLPCGTGHLAGHTDLLAADVRDNTFLAEERTRRASEDRLRRFAQIAAVVLVALCAFQVHYIARKLTFGELQQQIKKQRPFVQTLKDQEALAKSVESLSRSPLEIFEWLSAANHKRPDAIAFHSATADSEGFLSFKGEAPSVQVVNQYRDELTHSGSFAEINLTEINSENKGVSFSMRLKVKHTHGGPT